MKTKKSGRFISGMLALGLTVSILPAPVMAAETVTTNPGGEELNVEYFNSTFYNWDEEKANQATQTADLTNVSYQREWPVRWSSIAPDDTSTPVATDYWYKVDDSYYLVYYTMESSVWYSTRTIGYYANGNYTQLESTNSSYYVDTTLYTRTGTYQGKGFYFTNGDVGGRPADNYIPAFSKWTDSSQNYKIYSGLAAEDLNDTTNVPFNTDDVNAAPLFATDGSNSDYTDVYEDVKVPYVYDEDTGYYTLNSDEYAVYFGDDPEDDATLQIANRPASHTFSTYAATAFLPFNPLSNTTRQAQLSTEDRKVSSYAINGTDDFGFGMVTEVNFQMTDTGLDERGQPITFEFSGDDDVWVYIDDQLVLDIGGTHDAIKGTINFQTGQVELEAPAYDQIGDLAQDNGTSDTLTQTNLYTSLGSTRTEFASQGQHTLKIYYMERGRGRSNCLIQFNLPQRDTVSVTKNITQSKTPDGNVSDLTDAEQELVNGWQFGFTLYKDDEPVSNASYYVTRNGERTRNASTDSNGHFILQNGETATFLGAINNNKYYVVEDSPTGATNTYTEPEYSYQSTASGTTQAEDANGFISMKVAAAGSETSTDAIEFICTNYMNAELPNPSIYPEDDRIVIDYGLPISIAADRILENDGRRGDTFEITSVSGGTFGTAVLSDDRSTIEYTLNQQLNGIDEITYTAIARSSGLESEPETGTIYIIPATSMYYEEDFGEMIDYSDETIKWEQEGNSSAVYQETGYVGDDSDSTYGADQAYLNNTGDSLGTSKHAHAEGVGAQFTYDFTGTGTAIYGRTSTTTGYIEVTITNRENDEIVDRQYIDTRIINSMKYHPNEDTEEQVTAEELYNIPIYNNSGLDYGSYYVRVYLYKEGTPVMGYKDENGDFVQGSDQSGADFYLDGVRVYQPLVDNAIAESAYAADGESNISVMNIGRKMIADAEEGYSDYELFTLTDINDEIIDVEEYDLIGPNEELYLGPGYNVTFNLVNWDSQLYDLYLGLKVPDGKTGKIAINGHEVEINNSADCYYDISNYVDVDEDMGYPLGIVTITGVEGLVALTNIKVTGTQHFDLGYSQDIEVNGIESDRLYLVSPAYVEENLSGTEEIVPTFVPESVKLACSYGSKTRKATVTVLTSKDVSYVTVNGERIDFKKVNGKYKFTYSQKNVEAGTVFEIVAYRSDGAISETYTVVAD